MSEDRKKRGVTSWACAALALVVVSYTLSYGPACWLAERDTTGQTFAAEQHNSSYLYWPIGWAAANGPKQVCGVIDWYATLRHRCVATPAHWSGAEFHLARQK